MSKRVVNRSGANSNDISLSSVSEYYAGGGSRLANQGAPTQVNQEIKQLTTSLQVLKDSIAKGEAKGRAVGSMDSAALPSNSWTSQTGPIKGLRDALP